MIGQTVSHYTILAELGRGGMGVVYKAQDTTLDRFVALKFLPSHLAASGSDKDRFMQEAKAASAINHPNICTIHAVGEHEGQLFIVMEYVDGQTLAERKAAISQKQAIEYGIQIADGLAAAHDKGIVHRDIKPDNIMVRKDGIVQIMDFGLAKLAGVSRLTKEGSTVGTAGYMSPEQVQGLDADHRTDIFSFGVLLYEMLGGELPFRGAHETAMMYEIVNVEAVPLSAAHPEIDAELDAIVLECLAKDPDERYQSIREVSKELRRFKRTSSRARVSRVMPTRPLTAVSREVPAVSAAGSGEPPAEPGPRKRGPLLWIATSALLLVSVIALAVALVRSGGRPEPIIRSSLLSPPGVAYNTTVGGHLALSPDGTKLAFVAADSTGKQALWVRSLALMSATVLAGTERSSYPFWSPDSRSLGFFADGKLKRIDVAGGPPLTICDAPSGRGGCWNEAGLILFAPGSSDPIHRVNTGGGKAEPVTALDTTRGETSHRWPCFLPDQNHFLYTSQAGTGRVGAQEAIHVASLDGPERSLLLYASSNAVYANDYLLYVREQSLVAQPFNSGAREMRGDAFPVSDLVQFNQARSRGIFSASSNGMLVYQAGSNEDARMVWVDRRGAVIAPIVGRAPSYFSRVSPDGARIVFDDYDAESRNTDLWLHEVKRNVTTRFTFHVSDDLVPVWTPDGQSVLFSSNRNGAYEVFIKSASGADEEKLLLSDGKNELYPTGVTRSGRFVVLSHRLPNARWDLYYADLQGEKKPIPFLVTEFNEWLGVFSPDGRWVAYQSDESGKFEVYVRPFPGGGGKWQISTGGGQTPIWSADGNEIYYDSGTGKWTSVKVQLGAQTLSTGIPESLFDLTGREQLTVYDQSPDGKRFVAQLDAGERSANPATLVVNWIRDVEQHGR
jgi:serine/threonine protein kinase/Tol biopolymer transport system component